MSEPKNKLQNRAQIDAKIDQLARGAIQQATPKRTAFDEAVLAAAHSQAAINRQTKAQASDTQFSDQTRGNNASLKWWQRPVWLGAGSTVAVLATTLILTSQPEPQTGNESGGREVASSSTADTKQEVGSPPKSGQTAEPVSVVEGASKVASVTASAPAKTSAATPVPLLTPKTTQQSVLRPAPISAPVAAPPAAAPTARSPAPANELRSAPVTSNKSVDQQKPSQVEERREQKIAIADLAVSERATRSAESAATASSSPPINPPSGSVAASALASAPPQQAAQTKRAADAAELDPAQCRKLIMQISIDARNAENPAWTKVASNCAKRFPNEAWELHLGPISDLKSAR
jgi:hypothetical protein